MLDALYNTEYVIKVHTKNKMGKTQTWTDKIARSCNAYKSHRIDIVEKVVFQHAFKNVNGKCSSYLLWDIFPQFRS